MTFDILSRCPFTSNGPSEGGSEAATIFEDTVVELKEEGLVLCL
jgi:hypothetical protein